MNISENEYSHDDKTWDGAVEGPHPPPSLTTQDVVALVIYVVVFAVGVPGNLLVLWVTGSQVRRSINAIWFLNLAVADLLSCLALPIIIASIMHNSWTLGKMACYILPSFFSFNLYASVLLLATISADRFLLVFQPVWCQNYRVARLAWLACGIAWMLALVLSIPYFVFGRFSEGSLSKKAFCRVALLIGRDQVEIAVTITQFVLTFLVPLVTMSICYSFLLLRAWRSPATLSTKTLKVVLAVVTSFFIFWLPYQVSRMLFVFPLSLSSPSLMLAASLYVIGLALSFANCCINPIIYVAAARSLHIRVFKFRPGRLHKLLTEE